MVRFAASIAPDCTACCWSEVGATAFDPEFFELSARTDETCTSSTTSTAVSSPNTPATDHAAVFLGGL